MFKNRKPRATYYKIAVDNQDLLEEYFNILATENTVQLIDPEWLYNVDEAKELLESAGVFIEVKDDMYGSDIIDLIRSVNESANQL